MSNVNPLYEIINHDEDNFIHICLKKDGSHFFKFKFVDLDGSIVRMHEDDYIVQIDYIFLKGNQSIAREYVTDIVDDIISLMAIELNKRQNKN